MRAANALNEEIVALKSYEVNIKYNGEIQTMYDANGKQVFTIMYEGTTYVPVRAVSNIFGVPVDWDGETQTVLLGENDEWRKLTAEDFSRYTAENFYEGIFDVTVDGKKYETGIKAESTSKMYIANPSVYLELDNKCSELQFKVVNEYRGGSEEKDLKVVVTDRDSKKIIAEKSFTTNSSVDVTVDVSEYNNLKITIEQSNYKVDGEGSTTYLLDMKVR